MPASQTLEFETAHFLHGLFADDLANLKILEERLGVSAAMAPADLIEDRVEELSPYIASCALEDLTKARRGLVDEQGRPRLLRTFRELLRQWNSRLEEQEDAA